MKINPGAVFYLVCIIFMLVSAGCGAKSDIPVLADVSGTVTRKGKPVENVIVEFHPEKGRMSTASTNEKGRFQLVYLKNTVGAVHGNHEVFFIMRAAPDQKSNEKGVPPEVLKEIRIREQLNTVQMKHTEKVEVKPGENDFTFNLTGKNKAHRGL